MVSVRGSMPTAMLHDEQNFAPGSF